MKKNIPHQNIQPAAQQVHAVRDGCRCRGSCRCIDVHRQQVADQRVLARNHRAMVVTVVVVVRRRRRAVRRPRGLVRTLPVGQRLADAGSAALDKCGGRLVVNTGQRRDVADQLVEQRRLEQVRFLGDERLVGQHYFLRSRRVRRQQTPVDEPAIAQVRIVRVLRGQGEHVLHQFLGILRTLQEQLHDRRQ